MSASPLIPLPWFDADDYAALKALLKDGETALPPAHAQWLEQARARERQEIMRGHDICRVPVRPHEFAAWCDGLMLPTREACELYAAVQARRQMAAAAAAAAAPTLTYAPGRDNPSARVEEAAPPVRPPALAARPVLSSLP